jgi:hypothetical protein
MPSRSIEDGHNCSGHFFPPHDMLFLTGALDARPLSFSITSTGIFAVHNELAARAFREMSSSFARWGLRAVRRYTYADPLPVANQ